MPKDLSATSLRIHNAIVAETSEKGIGAVAMLPIAKRAKVSAGTLYNRYASKEDMLQQTYLQIKHRYHAQLMQVGSGPSNQVIRRLWINFFAFIQDRPQELLFLEYAGAAQLLTDAQRAEIAPMQAEVSGLVQTALDDGTMRPIPLSVAIDLLMGAALALARRHALAGNTAPISEIDTTFETLWSVLRAEPQAPKDII